MVIKMKIFVVKFQELLSYSGKLQKDICAEIGVSKQKLSKWKTGYNEPSLEELVIIAKYFNVSTDYLLGLEEDEIYLKNKRAEQTKLR